jgi:hypothetical protein
MMHQSDPERRTSVTEDSPASIHEAEPYRSPGEVSDSKAAVGLRRRPLAWMLLIGVLVGAAAALTSVRRSTDRGVINYVEEFGDMRRGPIESREIVSGDSPVLDQPQGNAGPLP